MRRSRNMGHAGGMHTQMSTGPLITDHLRDIDLELELLKRKRQLMEGQHLMPFNISNFNQPQRSYNQQAYTYVENSGQGSSNYDFSQLYANGPQQNRQPLPKKRPSDSNWQHDSYPKKSARRDRGYSGPSPIRNQKPFASVNQPKGGYPKKPGQGKLSRGQRSSNQIQQNPEKNFVAQKITKPTKKSAPPNKIASQPIPERNRLEVATKSVAKTEIPDSAEFRLLPDQEPGKQIKGRMEMSLGSILTNVREVYAESPHLETLRTMPYQRIIKQAIRDRLRTALLGKIVGTTKEIIDTYRAMFPKETDREIVDEAINAIGVSSVGQLMHPVANKKTPTYTVRPDDVVRENIMKLVNSHLHEMFNKIEEIYNSPNEVEGNDSQAVSTEDNLEAKAEPTVNKDEEVNKTDVEVITNENTKTDDQPNKDAELQNNEDGAKKDKDSVKKDDVAAAAKMKQYAAIKAAGDEAAAQLGLVDQMAYKKLLPRMLKKNIPAIVKQLNINKMYREALHDLIVIARAKYLEIAKQNKEKPEEPQPTESIVVAPNTKKPPQYPLPYYVKVMGKPQLPKKQVMQQFLEQYNPKSIKKHRTIHNLLFIGFTEKSDFDAMVAANGTVIGRTTLSVRICDNTTDKKEDNSSENVENQLNASTEACNKKPEDKDSSNEDILGADINGQIDDLLDSVKQTEDNSSENLNDSSESKKENVSENDINAAEDTAIEKDTTETNVVEKGTDEIETSTEDTGIEKENPGDVKDEAEDKPEEVNEESKDAKMDSDGDVEIINEKIDQVSELNAAVGKATPTRASTRLANVTTTPSSIRTRRASKLSQN